MRRAVKHLLITLLFSSCATPNVSLSTQRDSLRVQIIEREVTLRDTVIIEIPKIVERVLLRQDSSLLLNEFARSQALIQPDGFLLHTLETIPQQLKEPIASQVVVRDSIVYREIIKVERIEVERRLSRWQRWQIGGFWLLLSSLALMLYLRLRLG